MRTVDDDAIRQLLAGQPHCRSLPHPPGAVALLRNDVEDAGADMPAIERWVGARSGELRIAPSVKTHEQSEGGRRSEWSGPFRYYVIPQGALVESRAKRP
jgi:hypothetical protein